MISNYMYESLCRDYRREILNRAVKIIIACYERKAMFTGQPGSELVTLISK